MANAYFEATGFDYIRKSQNEVLGQLARNHHHALEDKQRFAWEKQIEIMRPIMAEYPKAHVYFEFSIPRMGKRADAVLVIQNVIFVIEFKVNSKEFDKYALDQAHDYALDLKNFHRGSHAEMLVPIVVATQAVSYDFSLNLAADQVAAPLQCSETTLLSCITSVLSANLNSAQAAINVLEWAGSGYLPTPTIIEAATALYQNHEDDHAVFLSGNGPLVDVLREALVRDETARTKIPKVAFSCVDAFIQSRNTRALGRSSVGR